MQPIPPEKDQSGCSTAQFYFIDDAIESLGFGLFHWISTLCCGWISFVTGLSVMIIAVLSPLVKCEWSLSSEEEALITAMLFLGYAIGNILWGYFSDRFGRKKSLLCSSALLLLSGVLGALKLTSNSARNPGYFWMLLWRFVAGLGAPAFEQSLVYYIELLPLKFRGVLLLILMSFFSVGTIVGPALAMLIVGFLNLNWHWLLGIASVPSSLLIFCTLPFLPESPRWYISKESPQKAEKVLKLIARWNCKKLPEGCLISDTSQKNSKIEGKKRKNCARSESEEENKNESALIKEGRSRFPSEKNLLLHSSDNSREETDSSGDSKRTALTAVLNLKLLFVDKMWQTSLLLTILWTGIAWVYIGCILLSTSMLINYPHCSLATSNSPLSNYSSEHNTALELNSTVTCNETQLSTATFTKIFLISLSELPAIFIPLFLIELLGRKWTLLVNLLFAIGGFGLLYLCVGKTWLTVFFITTRVFIQVSFKTLILYSGEVLPTRVRGAGLGILSSFCRLGAAVTPFVAQVLYASSDYAAIGVYIASCLLLAVAAILLPIKTKRKPLKE